MSRDAVDVLVVGAGPTGLTLAAELAAYGVPVRIVDAKAGPVAQSRALAIQPRTLEVLRGPVTDRLLARGNPGVRLQWHAGGRTATLPLFDLGLDDTAFPFLLFLSQAETEAVLVEHLADSGIDVEWGTRLTEFTDPAPDGAREGDAAGPIGCRLTDAAGRRHQVSCRYLVGCDGAHSAVREGAGIAFPGGRYPQTFLLADTDADGLAPVRAHVWFGETGPLLFFPLLRPAPWRVLTPRPSPSPGPSPGPSSGPSSGTAGPDDPAEPVDGDELLRELRSVVDAATAGTVRLAEPVWSTAFRIHHRQAAAYRRGRVFLAGDAAHIHSPAGGQGMNVGIQDAVNLGWKLALVCRGRTRADLLDTYETERRPVGASVLRLTDRAFTVATSSTPLVRLARAHVAPRALTLAARTPRLRAAAFRTLAQLSIRYPATEAETPGGGATRGLGHRLRRHPGRAPSPRPRPGERFPDLPVATADGPGWLHDHLTGPGLHLLLCGPVDAWDPAELAGLTSRYAGLLRAVTLAPAGRPPAPGVLTDVDLGLRRRLGVRGTTSLLVRPDGHVWFRAEGPDLGAVGTFLADRLVM